LMERIETPNIRSLFWKIYWNNTKRIDVVALPIVGLGIATNSYFHLVIAGTLFLILRYF
jgi:hypothetical protein